MLGSRQPYAWHVEAAVFDTGRRASVRIPEHGAEFTLPGPPHMHQADRRGQKAFKVDIRTLPTEDFISAIGLV